MSRPGPPGLSAEQRPRHGGVGKSGHGVRGILDEILGFDHGSIRSLLVQEAALLRRRVSERVGADLSRTRRHL